jgi:predicted nucleic acid-binding protein
MRSCLLDTSILVQLGSTASRLHAAAAAAVEGVLTSGARVVIAPQNIYEFWSVATRPPVSNGLGWPVERAAAAIETICARFPVLSEPPEVVGIWLRLVQSRDLKGKRIHDAHLHATLIANGISHLLTFNASDFPPTDAVAVLTPRP